MTRRWSSGSCVWWTRPSTSDGSTRPGRRSARRTSAATGGCPSPTAGGSTAVPCDRRYGRGVAEETFAAGTPEGPISGHTGGTGAPVLLLHGGPAISDYTDMLGPELGEWRWARYQQRGLPPSAVGGPFTVAKHVADAVAVLDTLGIEQAVVLGHSWGGHLALHLALVQPGRVAGLVIVDPLGAVGDGGVTEMGQELTARLSPAAATRLREVDARLEGPDPTDDDALASLTLVWPGQPGCVAAALAKVRAQAGLS